MDVQLDATAPVAGSAIIVTSEYLNGELSPKVCQKSTTTIALMFDGFVDPETGIDRYWLLQYKLWMQGNRHLAMHRVIHVIVSNL